MPHSAIASTRWGDLHPAGLEEPSSYGITEHKGRQLTSPHQLEHVLPTTVVNQDIVLISKI